MAPDRRRQQYQHHEAATNLTNFFTKAHHDLSLIHVKLEREFHHIYPDNANPMNLVARVKKMEEDLLTIKDQCRELLVAKQDLIDKATSVLVGNRSMLQRMQTSLGIPVETDSEDSTFTNFNEVIQEWAHNVRSRTEDEDEGTESHDINNMLFSSIVRSN